MYPDSYLKGTFKILFLQSSKKVIFMPLFFKEYFAFLHKYKKVLSTLQTTEKEELVTCKYKSTNF